MSKPKAKPSFSRATLTEEQHQAAKLLNTGNVLGAYMDNKALRMETENGNDPYVWRYDQKVWVPMRQ